MQREGQGIPQDQLENVTLEVADIEASNELIGEAFDGVPTGELVKEKLEAFLTEKGVAFSDRSLSIFKDRVLQELNEKALKSIKDKLNPKVLHQMEDSLFEEGSSDGRNEFEYLGASDLTFSPSDLRIAGNGKLGATNIRESIQKERKDQFEKIEEAVKEFKME